MTVAADRVSEFLEGVRRSRREIVTPEGVALPVDLAEHGGRAAAFAIDMVIWLCTTIALYLVIIAALRHGTAVGIVMTLVLFIAFLVRNLYFIYFELIWRGATPGKRVCGLRVIDRRGGPLTPAAVVARNLTREVEIFLPLGAVLSLGPGTWTDLFLVAWLLLLTALPLFNRDRMRAGDFIAGTIVIAVPKRMLLADLVQASTRHRFTPQQLGAYGAFELQILEELLRRPASAETDRLLADVCGKICRKIEWTQPVPAAETRRFLTAFYTAERAHLEQEQLFGRARADKHSRPG
ncbi:MAG: RDD family protein [Inquilinus limosus]|uniref:RDD family protein n=1 Tax=Inquilinus limosus TaxID=171674 RepID=A0A952KKM7_9PROT|nr:RDD family protein [Inquilinus limosus]